jgi:HEAT repeats
VQLRDLYASIQQGSGPVEGGAADAVRSAASSSRSAFVQFLASVPLDRTCVLFEIYEVLIQDSDRHFAVLLGELKRLLVRAHGEPRNKAIYDQLAVFAIVQNPDMKNAIADALVTALRSSAPQVRRFAADLAGDVLSAQQGELLALLRDLRVQDPDRRVRLLADESLRDFGRQHASVPALSEMRLSDRLMARLMGTRVREFAA